MENGRLGHHVICVHPVSAGEPLFEITGRKVDLPDRYSIQVGETLHLSPEGAPWSLVNHSCNPNTIVDFETWTLVACRNIAPSEEITWNYLTTEWQLDAFFECRCGDAHCAGTIRGFGYLDGAARDRLADLLSPYLQSKALSGELLK